MPAWWWTGFDAVSQAAGGWIAPATPRSLVALGLRAWCRCGERCDLVGRSYAVVTTIFTVGQGVEDGIGDFFGAFDGEDAARGEVAGNAQPVIAFPPVNLT